MNTKLQVCINTGIVVQKIFIERRNDDKLEAGEGLPLAWQEAEVKDLSFHFR